MKFDWVFDILKDMRQFSATNGMMELAEQLDDAIFVAACEISSSPGVTKDVKVCDGKLNNSSECPSGKSLNPLSLL